jgi:hypothetical protein
MALVGVAAVLLLGCLVIGGGLAVYFAARSSGPSPESQLVGHWEMDRDYLKDLATKDPMGALAVNLIAENTFDFRPDHTFKMWMVMPLDGKWKVTGRKGNTISVTLIFQMFGMDAEPTYATFTMLDNDRFDFEAPPQKTMTGKGRFRRAGPPR